MTFQRDRFTWIAYTMLALFAYVQAIPGAIVPFLRDELRLSYTEMGWHFSAFSLGQIIGSLVVDAVARQWGRKVVIGGGALGMMLGGLAFTQAQIMELTLLSIFSIGLMGSGVIIMVQAALIDYHPQHRALALTEVNIAASIAAMLGPLLVGGLEETNIGWRGAIYLHGLMILSLFFLLTRTRVPEPVPDAAATTLKSRLPTAFWMYWLLLFVAVSGEWCVVYWGSEYLDTEIGFKASTAAALMSVYFVANIVGRIVGSRLTQYFQLDKLILLATIVSIAGFLPFWLAPVPAISVAGLFVAGLGIANLFPLGLAAATGVIAPHQSNAASGRIALAAGLAIFLLPQVLGRLADSAGIKNAYGVVLILFAIIIVMAGWQVRAYQEQGA